MRTKLKQDRRRGVANTEYIILVLAIAVILVSVVVNLGATVKALWSGSLEGGMTDLSETAEHVDAMDDAPPPCPYEFDSGTGRWHNPSDGYAFVTFEDASAANCS